MPTYQYTCTECSQSLEAVQSFSDPALTDCPACRGRLRKVFNSVGIVFKGSGFYRTDSRTGGAGTESAKADGKSDSKADGKSEAKTESKSDASSNGSSSTSAAATSSSSSNGGSSNGTAKAGATSGGSAAAKP